MIVFASARGALKHPAWYHNLLAHPEVTGEHNDESYRMHATVADGQEYIRLYKRHSAQFPNVLEHQKKDTRRIPIVILEPMD